MLGKEAIFKSEFVDKVETVQQFREKRNITAQAVNYLIDKNLIDFVDMGFRIKLIVLTEKTLAYQPNAYPKTAR